MAQTQTFDSFGKQTASSGSLINPFQYTGRESDTETGLDYYRARYYSPTLQRFVSEDPIGLAGGANAILYAGNSPVNFLDPLGLFPWFGGTSGGGCGGKAGTGGRYSHPSGGGGGGKRGNCSQPGAGNNPPGTQPPNTQPPNTQPPNLKQQFCFYTSWAAGASGSLGAAAYMMGGGSGILELGLGTAVGSMATASGLAIAAPYLIFGGLALWGARQVVCT